MSTAMRPKRERPELYLVVEPSTDFPSLEDLPEKAPRRRWWLIALVVAFVVLVGALAFWGGRASAAPTTPQACVEVMNAAHRGFAVSETSLGTTQDGLAAVIDGELSQAALVSADVRGAITELGLLHDRFDQAATACRSAG